MGVLGSRAEAQFRETSPGQVAGMSAAYCGENLGWQVMVRQGNEASQAFGPSKRPWDGSQERFGTGEKPSWCCI